MNDVATHKWMVKNSLECAWFKIYLYHIRTIMYLVISVSRALRMIN